MPVKTPVDEAYKKSVGADLTDIARFLQDNLGQKLVAYLTNLSDEKQVGRWSRGEHRPRPESEAALRAAYLVFQMLAEKESAHIARAWFIGMNPQLDGESPASVIRQTNYRKVWLAAKKYLEE
jgi:hypothetical protein